MFESVKKIGSKVSKAFLTKRTPEEEVFHRELVRVGAQMRMTEKLIMNNMTVIQEIAKDDEGVASLLQDVMNSKKRAEIEQAILNRKDISNADAKYLTSSLEKMTDTMSKLGVSFQVSIPETVKDIQELLNDSRIDVGQRRKMLIDLKDFLKDSGNISSSLTLAELSDINTDQLNFTEKEANSLSSINNLINKLVDETSNVKLFSKDQTEALKVIINDTGKDKVVKKQMLTELKKQIEVANITSESIEELKSLDIDNLKFLKKDRTKLSKLLDKIGTSTVNEKINLTLTEFNKKMDASVLTQGEVKELMEQQMKDGKSFRENFEKMADRFSRGNAAGLIPSLLSLISPELGAISETIDLPSKLAGGAAGLWGLSKMKGMFSKIKDIPKILSKAPLASESIEAGMKVASKGGKFGKLAALGLGAFSAAKMGLIEKILKISDKAGSILGKGASKFGSEATDVGAKVLAKTGMKVGTKIGLKSILKKLPFIGLALGLYFAYKRLQVGDFIGAGIEATSGLAAMIPGFGTLGSLGIDAIGMSRNSGWSLNPLKWLGGNKGNDLQTVPNEVKSNSLPAEIENEKKKMNRQGDSKQGPAIIPMPSPAPQQHSSVDRRLSVDDFGLAFMNSVVFG